MLSLFLEIKNLNFIYRIPISRCSAIDRYLSVYAIAQIFLTLKIKFKIEKLN